ncbi:MAG: B12-binding domain-containing radical SAM protein [Myxococcota bacterium]
MDVLLIKPFSNTPISPLPIGLLYVGTFLKKYGHSVRILDAHINKIKVKKIPSIIRELNPDIIGITNMTSETVFMRRMTEAIKNSFPDIKIILGGPHISSFKRIEFEQNPFIDYGVIGEGEVSSLELIRRIEENVEPSDVSGIIYRRNKEIIETGPSEFVENIDILPIPDFSLINMEDYFKYFGTAFNLVVATDRIYPLMSSRGCPFGCKFCHNIFGRRIRYFSIERIIEEINLVKKKFGVEEIDFLDDTINANNKKTLELFEALPYKKELHYAIPSGVRGDLFSEELLFIMKEIGLFRINIAFESAVQRILDISGKNMKIEKTIENTYRLKGVSRLIGGFFMFGFPTETEGDIMDTIELMQKLPLHTASVSFVTPYPDTAFFRFAEERYPLSKIIDKLIRYDTFYSEPISICEVSEDRLMELKKIAVRKFYIDIDRIIRNIKDVPNYYSLIRNGINVLKLSIFKNVPY